MDRAWHQRRDKAIHSAIWEWQGIKLGGYAEIYGVSRQGIYHLSSKSNLTPDHWSNPRVLHELLVERANDSPLRRRVVST